AIMKMMRCGHCGAQNRVDERASGRPICGKCHAPLAVDTSAGDGRPVTVTDATFAREVLNSHRPVLLDCWASWCRPCRMLAPVLDEIAHEANGRYVVAKLNV